MKRPPRLCSGYDAHPMPKHVFVTMIGQAGRVSGANTNWHPIYRCERCGCTWSPAWFEKALPHCVARPEWLKTHPEDRGACTGVVT